MKLVTSLVLGSAAGLVVMSGAQAADLPVKAKAVEYVKICTLYGAGFYYIPGTDTCMKIGGYLRADLTLNGSAHGGAAYTGDLGLADRYKPDFVTRSRFALTVDTRTATEYGVVRTFGQVDLQFSTLNNGSYSPANQATNTGNNPILDTAGQGDAFAETLFIQFAGFTFGRSQSAFSTPWAGSPGNTTSSLVGSSDSSLGVPNIQYTWQFGNGVSASFGIEEGIVQDRTSVYNLSTGGVGIPALPLTAAGTGGQAYAGNRLPDFVGNVRVDQAWGLFQLSGSIHEVSGSYNSLTGGTGLGGVVPTTLSQISGHPDSKIGGSVMAALQIKNLPTGAGDDIKFSTTWTRGDIHNVIATTSATPNYLMTGSSNLPGAAGSFAFGAATDGVWAPVGAGGDGQIHLTTGYGVQGAFNHNWNPNWSSSLFGGMAWVRYDSTARTEYCNNYFVATGAGNAATTSCNPNYTASQVGINTRWTPVKNLTLSAEAVWFHLGTGFSGFGTYSPGSPIPAGIYQFKNQNTAELQLRVQRNF